MKIAGKRVLLADDEPQLREGYARWLTRLGAANVFTAANGVEALEICRTHSVDLLISDVQMPVMDGVTLVARLSEAGKTLPRIVFISGFSQVDQALMTSIRVDALLSKPFSPPELVAAIEAIPERRPGVETTDAA